MADLHINDNKGWKYKWSEYEDKIIKKYYPKFGASKVQEFLPNRNLKAIQQHAFKIGVKYLRYNEEYFDIIDNPTKAYWLGFLYADGYITTDSRWGLELCEDDKEHMQQLLNQIEYNGNIRQRERNGNKSCSFQIKNRNMHKSLENNGVVMNKTSVLKFPDESVLDPKYYSHFIRGFFDGDGSISYNYITKPRKDRGNKIYTRLVKEVNIVCKSDSFVEKLLEILSQNNINLNWNITKQHNNLNVIRTGSMQEITKFYEYIYSNSLPSNRLKRKYEKFNNLFIATNSSDAI